MKHSPSCKCCECAPVIPSDAAYEVCKGAWVAGAHTNGRKTSSTNAKILLLPPFAPTTVWRAKVSVEVITNAANATWEVKLIAANEQLDNGTGTGTGTNSGYCGGTGIFLIWGQDIDGEYFVFHDSSYPFDHTCGSPISGAGTFRRDLMICWDGTYLTAGWSDTPLTTWTQIATTEGIPIGYDGNPGDRFGFATSSFNSGVTSVEFYDFTVHESNRVIVVGGDIPCGPCTVHCCKGPVPSELILELDLGLKTGTGTDANFDLVTSCLSSPTGRYQDLCADITGTYILSVGACGGGVECGWGELHLESGVCSGFADKPYTVGITAVITAATIGGVLRRIILVQVSSVDVLGTYIACFRAIVDEPCVDWTDWIDLEAVICPSGSSACLGVGRIKAA